MSLQPQPAYPIPDETRRVAHAAFPKGSLCLRLVEVLGQLYLDDGVVGGERILPEGWVDYSALLTPGSETYGYGAGFWTNRGTTGGAAKRIALGMPLDSFMARGTQRQYIVIVPSARRVVVRLGMAHDRYEDIDGVARLIADAIAAEAK